MCSFLLNDLDFIDTILFGHINGGFLFLSLKLFFFLLDFLLKLTKHVSSFTNVAAILQIFVFSFGHDKVVPPGHVFLIWLDNLLTNTLILDVLVVTFLARIV
jgi:hypothetical protein